MANPLKGQVELELAGQIYKARLTIEAIMSIENALGSSLLKLASKMSDGDVGVTEIVNILHPGLRGGGNDLSMQQVMQIVDDAGIVASTVAISNLLGQTLNPKGTEGSSKKQED